MEKRLPYIMPVFRSVLFLVGGLLFALITNQSLDESTRWWPVLCIFFNVITIFVLALVCKHEGLDYRDLIDYRKGQLGLKNILIISTLMLLSGVGGLYAFGIAIFGYVPTILIQPIPVWIAIISMILLPVTIVFAELPLYYGYSFRRIVDRTGNRGLAIGYIVFFYALQHSFIPLLVDWRYMLFRFLSFIPLLIVLSIIYIRKRALAPLMIGHGVLDFATGIQILISSIFPAIFAMM